MIYFLGNCQADFVSRTMADKGFDTTYRVLASPLTYTSHPGQIPPVLAETVKSFGLGDYFLGRELINQFCPVTKDEAPELIVLSMFHENVPLFLHNEEEFIFYMDTNALTEVPAAMLWAQENCRMFQPNPVGYLKRFKDMLEQLRKDVPKVPIVILGRLSPYPAFGPAPYSYLEKWEEFWLSAKEEMAEWPSTMENVHILEMDRVFAGIWTESETAIESHCPFLKLELEETDGQITGLHARRDIEHIGPMPARLADKLIQFQKNGRIEYEDSETVPRGWHRQWRMSKLDDEAMLRKLVSGANYQCAEAIGSFFLDLSRDRTALLVQARERMPVCHNTLHMIKAYSRIFPNPDLAVWCEAHRRLAESFMDNGPIYQQVYLKRIDEIQHRVLGQS
ncbi:SGNH/GDSL hydrolase family protein [Pseudodesulfovibrio sp. zrk46]|uniref:SGNH/GDSL hydrolase family protein n=1 Tax=Pseudodesulfovibrio sp. zrk46 TaxID=2725288 RepID=UPI0014496D2A|nr:SGNH/GDSL hydrolase family protein [Pseudodesulfovibrio sp. zrk46]QJB57242.1 SGNH/GDSL hydrolase family protein [Pseudodesulfovibrio sp. zrk46]